MDSHLLDQLAGEAAPHALRAQTRRASLGIGVGFAVALALTLGWLGLRQDIVLASATPIFWIKLAFPALLAALASWAVWCSARPGLSLRAPLTALAAAVVLFWAVTFSRPWLLGSPIDWEADLWGRTWRECAVYIALMALPIMLPAMAWLRRFGPVSPRQAGALVGALCGTLSAALYALHCRESGMAFLGMWYLLGAAMPAALGAALGRRWLNW
jgi:hypothetical protein